MQALSATGAAVHCAWLSAPMVMSAERYVMLGRYRMPKFSCRLRPIQISKGQKSGLVPVVRDEL